MACWTEAWLTKAVGPVDRAARPCPAVGPLEQVTSVRRHPGHVVVDRFVSHSTGGGRRLRRPRGDRDRASATRHRYLGGEHHPGAAKPQAPRWMTRAADPDVLGVGGHLEHAVADAEALVADASTGVGVVAPRAAAQARHMADARRRGGGEGGIESGDAVETPRVARPAYSRISASNCVWLLRSARDPVPHLGDGERPRQPRGRPGAGSRACCHGRRSRGCPRRGSQPLVPTERACGPASRRRRCYQRLPG